MNGGMLSNLKIFLIVPQTPLFRILEHMKSNLSGYSFLAFVIVILFAAYAFRPDDISGVAVNSIADEKGIQFIEQDWEKALNQAKEQKKLVFLDIYATWCGPCKMLKKNTFTDEEVGNFFNKNFINVSVDGEKTIGPQLARKYSIQGYPSLIVTDAEGNPVLYTAGYVEPEYLLAFAKEALKRSSSAK